MAIAMPPPGGDRPALPVPDAQCIAWYAVMGARADYHNLAWARFGALNSQALNRILAWVVGRIALTKTTFGGLLKRVAAAALAHNNTDDVLTVGAIDALPLPLAPPLPPAGGVGAPAGAAMAPAGAAMAPWLASMSMGQLLMQEDGPKAAAWAEYHRCDRRQIRQPVIEGTLQAAVSAGRIDAYTAALMGGPPATDAEQAEAAAAAIARDVRPEPGLWKARPVGTGRATVGREELHRVGATALGAGPFMRDRLGCMVHAEAAVLKEGEDGRALLMCLSGADGRLAPLRQVEELLAALAATLLPPTLCQPERLYTPEGVRALTGKIKLYYSFLVRPPIAALPADGRVHALLARVAESGVSSSAMVPYDGGSSASLPRADMALTGHKAQLNEAKEKGDNPGIIADLIELVIAPGFDPLVAIHLGLLATTTACPARKPTGLSHQLMAGVLPGHAIDPRLAIVSSLWKEHGPRYLGKMVGKALVKDGFCTEEQVVGMCLDALAAWIFPVAGAPATGNFVNALLIPVLEHVHTGQSQGAAKMARVSEAEVYRDLLLNLRIPPLIDAVFKYVGQQFSGEHSLKHVFESSNAFMLFNAGITGQSALYLADGQRQLLLKSTSEQRTGYALCLDPRNPLAVIPPTQLRGSDDEGGRGTWTRVTTLALKASTDRQNRALTEQLHGDVIVPTAAGYAAAIRSPTKAATAAAVATAGAAVAGAGAAEKNKKKAEEKAKNDAAAKLLLNAVSYAGAEYGFADGSDTFFCGKTRWDAKAFQAAHPGACCGYHFTKSLPGFGEAACDDPSHPDHQGPDAAAHAKLPDGSNIARYNTNKKEKKAKSDLAYAAVVAARSDGHARGGGGGAGAVRGGIAKRGRGGGGRRGGGRT